MVRRTRLSEDAAIGAILSVFFGLSIVLLTVIQSMSQGRQAGLEGFLLGSTAGMLFQDAVLIAGGGMAVVVVIWLLRRPMTLVAFDAEYAAAMGYDVRRIDLLMMGLVLAVTVIGLKLVGLILIVAMLIIPPVTARFWTDRSNRVIWIAGLLLWLPSLPAAAKEEAPLPGADHFARQVGLRALKAGRPEEAAKHFLRALRDHPHATLLLEDLLDA